MRYIKDKEIWICSWIDKNTVEYINRGNRDPKTIWYKSTRIKKILLLDTETNKIKKELNPDKTPEINKDTTLCFSKSSKFPRFKIKDKFKRCVKPEKADFIVVPIIDFYNVRNRVIFESDTKVYMFDNQDNILGPGCTFSSTLSMEEYFKKHQQIFPEKVEFSFKGNVSYDTCIELVADFYNKGYKFITDKQLDAIVNQTLPEITMDDFNSISDLLNSTDKESQVLGLKSLPMYDITPLKYSVNYVFSKNYRKLRELPEWTSVSVSLFRKQMVNYESIDIFSCGRLLQLASSQQDIDFLYNHLVKLIMRRLEYNCDFVAGNDYLKKVNKQIKLVIE